MSNARYRATPPTYVDGDFVDISTDNKGVLNVNVLAGGSSTAQGTYNATPPTVADTATSSVQLDVAANLKVTNATLLAGEDLAANVQGVVTKPVVGLTYASTGYKDSGTVTKANIKNAAANLSAFRITNANAAVRYLQFHNKASAPAAGETAQLYYLIPAGTATVPGELKLDSAYFAPSDYFGTGLGWAISTTATTFTDSATAAEHTIGVRYS